MDNARTHFDVKVIPETDRLLLRECVEDNRNVPFQQTTDLVEKLHAQKVAFEAIGTLSVAAPVEILTRSGDRQLRAPHETSVRFAACHFH